MTDLPAPFCPPEIDRRTKPLVLFDFGRLLSSELWLTATAEELRAALSLWSHAVRQKPAASLPDNPRSLAGFAGVPPDGNRMRDTFRTLEAWRAYCHAIRGSPFLLGENDRGWRADFDFALKPRNISKILEGGYDRSSYGRNGPAAGGRGEGNPSPFDCV